MSIQVVTAIDCDSSKFPDIVGLINHYKHTSVEVHLEDANSWDFSNSKAVIISGGPHLFTDSKEKHNHLMQAFRFLKHLEIPTLGICLGHQAIALTFGGEVYRGEERRDQDDITVIKQHTLFSDLPCTSFAEDHCEGIHPSDRMQVLAQSDYYSVEALQIIDRPFLGVQFHPEISGPQGSLLINNFLTWADQQLLFT